ncbi:MAG TPA: SDR family oxidoreductase [Solirubrobacteraceae bacterium]|jgi:NAD(P)-dependent dehydrogenase (short-subunit alcohol dehydrogenase family)|nr:SDR family oxidoreductase [Solirubrobacteraceae bacterium]
MASRTWFITGTSRGFGREWALAALARGDRVVGTARDPSSMDDIAQQYGRDQFLPLQLDVTDRQADFEVVGRAQAHFGELDIVVNNAGYGHFGMVEELTEQEFRDQIETNLFGAVWVTQAALPYLRDRGRGHFLQVSSIGGITAYPGIGAYHASKWGLEAISQSLAQEVKELGIHVTIVEPAGFSTDWAGSSSRHSQPLGAYDHVREVQEGRRAGNVPGDPLASAEAVLRVVDAQEPPLRVFFGTRPLPAIEAEYKARIELWQEWNDVSALAQGDN